MSKRKSRKKAMRTELGRIRRSFIIVIALLLSVITVSGILAQRAARRIPIAAIQNQTQPAATVAPASFSPGSPSKEFIHAGGTILASEEPNSISPTSQSFAANGGTGTVYVAALPGVSWTAVSNAGWVTITSSTGSGNGTVTYSVGTNTATTIRNGTITIHGQTFTVYQGAAFLDVQPGHLYYADIGKLSARSVTLGCGGGYYCPDQIVTREQMAAFIIRALGDFNPPTPQTQRFVDVPPSNIFYNFIEQMALRQITLGCGGPNYCPAQNVTHEQMAAFIMRGKGEFDPPPPATQRFLDVPPSNTFYKFIERMGALGIWPAPPAQSGCSANNYCPTNPVTRSHMAWILVRAFNL